MKLLLKDQEWRATYNGGGSLRLNPPEEYIELMKGQHCLHFIHTGKCAGESIMRALKRDTRRIILLEYHVFDADKSIRSSLALISKDEPEKHSFVIATRDPLKRWESSFNWDLHNLVLKRGISIEKSEFSRYRNVNHLAHGIANKEADALRLGKWAHMGMGLSFYAPLELQNRLPQKQTYAIRLENINQDYVTFLKNLSSENLSNKVNVSLAKGKEILVPKTKDSYKEDYPPDTFARLKIDEINSLKHFLDNDYKAHNHLLQNFLRQPLTGLHE